MARGSSVGLLAGGAALVGLVWANRARTTRRRGTAAQAAGRGSDERLAESRDSAADIGASDAAARIDALRDARSEALRDIFDSSPDSRDSEVRIEAEDIDVLDLGADLGPLEQVEVADEPYDSVDAEDVGTEWLLRATQNSASHRRDPGESFEGAFSGTGPGDAGEAGPSEAGFGSDQEGAPLAPHAGTHEDDVAAELPVGNVDGQGNTELHAPANPPDGFRAPPTGELAVSERELAGRNHPPDPARR